MNSTWFTAVMLPVAPTVTVVEAVAAVPLDDVAVALYVVVCVGETLTVPPVFGMLMVLESTLLLMITGPAFCAVTVSTEFCPEEICAGLALIVTVGAGGGGGAALTVKRSVEEKKKPLESQARMIAVCVPAASATDAVNVTELARKLADPFSTLST